MKPSETLESRHSREWWFFSKFENIYFRFKGLVIC